MYFVHYKVFNSDINLWEQEIEDFLTLEEAACYAVALERAPWFKSWDGKIITVYERKHTLSLKFAALMKKVAPSMEKLIEEQPYRSSLPHILVDLWKEQNNR